MPSNRPMESVRCHNRRGVGRIEEPSRHVGFLTESISQNPKPAINMQRTGEVATRQLVGKHQQFRGMSKDTGRAMYVLQSPCWQNWKVESFTVSQDQPRCIGPDSIRGVDDRSSAWLAAFFSLAGKYSLNVREIIFGFWTLNVAT